MTKKERRRKKRKIIKRAIICELIILLICVIWIASKKQNEDVFYKGTIINGKDCSGLTIDEAKEELERNDTKKISIIFKMNQVETIEAPSYQVDKKKLQEVKEKQNKQLLFKGKEYNINYTYNKKKLKEELLALKQFNKSFIKENSKFSIEYNEEQKKFKMMCKDSYYLDIDEIINVIIESIEKGDNEVIISNKYYKENESSENKYIIDELNKKIASKIIYELPNGGKYELNADVLHQWLKKDSSYEYDEKLWQKNLKQFVSNDLTKMSETVGNERSFKPTDEDKTIIIAGGNYGYQLNVEKEIAKLKEDLKSQAKIQRKPIYKKVEASTKNDGLGNSYVEIDLTRQKVWVYVNGKIKVETECVSGCVEKGHATPTGIFFLTYKQKDRILKGKKLPNGRYEYQSHVNYWMPFNGGIGLHDAKWRSKFGGDIYVANGSHGCINLPKEDAEKIYNIIDEKMPIIVYGS